MDYFIYAFITLRIQIRFASISTLVKRETSTSLNMTFPFLYLLRLKVIRLDTGCKILLANCQC